MRIVDISEIPDEKLKEKTEKFMNEMEEKIGKKIGHILYSDRQEDENNNSFIILSYYQKYFNFSVTIQENESYWKIFEENTNIYVSQTFYGDFDGRFNRRSLDFFFKKIKEIIDEDNKKNMAI